MACDSPLYVLKKGRTESVPVPCGSCPPCQRRRIDGWVFRLQQEIKRSEYSYFVTLTYDTRFVPITANGFMTLHKPDLQKFFKRLRHNTGFRIKYYAVGEYGSTRKRPHYHLILFSDGCAIEEIRKAWPLGSVHVGQVTSDSIAYTLKYIEKKTGSKQHKRDDRLKEFSLMSKRLGDNYLTDQIISYHNQTLADNMYLVREGGYKVAMPRYYRERIFDEDTRDLQHDVISNRVKSALRKEEIEFSQNYPDQDFLAFKDGQKFARYKKFLSSRKKRSDL